MSDETDADDLSIKKRFRERLKPPFGRKREKEARTDTSEVPVDEEDSVDTVITESSVVRMTDRLKHLAHWRSRGATPEESNTTDAETQPDNIVIVETEPAPSRFNEAIARYRPSIEHVVLHGLIDVAESKLRDEIFLMSLFNRACDIILAPLPGAVRLVIPREMLLKWLMQNREPLLLKLNEYKATKSEAEQQVSESLPLPEQHIYLPPPYIPPSQDK